MLLSLPLLLVLFFQTAFAGEKYEDFVTTLDNELSKRFTETASPHKFYQPINTNEQVKRAKHEWEIHLRHLNALSTPFNYIVTISDLNKSRRDACAVYRFETVDAMGELHSAICKVYKPDRTTCIADAEYLETLNAWLNRNRFLDTVRDDDEPDVYKYPKITRMIASLVEKTPEGWSSTLKNAHMELHPPAILLEEALGQTVYDWMEKYAERSPSDKDAKTLAHAEKAGRQIGHFHEYFAKYNFLSGVLIMVFSRLHHDLHLENITYDKKLKRAYFIDNGEFGQHLNRFTDVRVDLATLFRWSPGILRRNLVLSEIPNFSSIIKLNASERERAKKIVLYFCISGYMQDPPFVNHRDIAMRIFIFYEALMFKDDLSRLSWVRVPFERIEQFLHAIKKGYVSVFSDPMVKAYISKVIDDSIVDDFFPQRFFDSPSG